MAERVSIDVKDLMKNSNDNIEEYATKGFEFYLKLILENQKQIIQLLTQLVYK